MEAALWAAIGALAALFASAIAFATFWQRNGSQITSANMKADNAILLATSAGAKAASLENTFGDHRAAVERELGKNEALISGAMHNFVQAEERLASALKEVSADVRGTNARIDRLIQSLTGNKDHVV
jgi:hypothetical protein